ncbi:hypothetical protein CAT37_09135 [Acinetobacter pittii]|uniref:FRG domain-containing protein n=1 Tax=Acinetobacter pittii TaxID=48296 RepID=UPI000A3C482B|nr:FRG domain-containing protein [Acinetobacter pittii]OTU44192.1 hypothetical protein CAT37_09135 [Acinetobacter pittii]
MNVYSPEIYLNRIVSREGYGELTVESSYELTELIRPDRKERLLHILRELYIKSIDKIDDKQMRLSFNKLIFRGVADSNFKLIPTLYRNPLTNEVNDYSRNYNEIRILRDFIKACDLSSTQIPNDSHKFRELINDDKLFYSAFSKHNNEWLAEDYFELTAFAQHYGLPTRLLDWSYHPLVSLYFASIGAIKFIDESKQNSDLKNKYFSIWVYSPIETSNAEHQKFYNSEIKIIDVPRSLNQHISFQQGCFILVTQDKSNGGLDFLFNEEGEVKEPAVDKFLTLNDKLHKLKLSNNLLKINIPFESAIEAYEYCVAYNFNSATLFRGPHGGSQHVLETMLVGKQKEEKLFGKK